MTPLYHSDLFQVVEYMSAAQEYRTASGVVVVYHRRIIEVSNRITETSAILSAQQEVDEFLRQVREWQINKPSAAEVEGYLSRYDPVSLFPIVRH